MYSNRQLFRYTILSHGKWRLQVLVLENVQEDGQFSSVWNSRQLHPWRAHFGMSLVG